MKRPRILFGNACLISVLTVFALMVVCATPVSAKESVQKPYKIEIYSLKMGFSGYVLSFALADLINKHSKWLRATAMETKGTVENMAILVKHPEKQKIWVGYMNPDTRHQARSALGPFKKPYDETVMLTSSTRACEFFATLDPKIKTYDDFIGKRVMIALKTSAPGQTYTFILREGLGIFDKLKISRGGMGASTNALIDGTADIGWESVQLLKQRPDGTWDWIPVPACGRLLETKKAYFIGVPEEVTAKASKLSKWPMTSATFAAGTHGKTTVGPTTGKMISLGWAVHKSMPDEVATEIVRIIWDNVDAFKKYHAVGRCITRKTMPQFAEPESSFHPAAIKFYKAQGVKKIGID